ncbi:MAG: putative lipid II flippase FtsW [bacterium]
MSYLRNTINRLLITKDNKREADLNLIITVSVVILFGLIMLSSASGALAYSRFGDAYYFLKHQIMALGIGMVFFVFFARFDYHRLREYSLYFLIFSVFLLMLVFVPGLSSSANDKARSWISIFGFSLQPSEFVKLFFLIYAAAWLESRGKVVADFKQGTLPFFVVYGVIAILMMLQPDFGTLSIITVSSLIAYFVGGGNIKHIAWIVTAGVLALVLMTTLMPYQARRFKCYWNPAWSADQHCYQLNQSMIAVGSGGLWGRGFGASRQKLMYLPEVSGDSIFPIIGEELGFIFSAALIALFLNIFYRSYLIAIRSQDHFGKVLAIGIGSWLVVQAFINIGGMIDFMPMTGVPLPFISSGGSAIMAAMSAIGVIINISRQNRV